MVPVVIVSRCFDFESCYGSAFAYLDLVPVLSGERILGSLLETLLSLGEALVPIALLEAIRYDGSRQIAPKSQLVRDKRSAEVALGIRMPGI